MIYQDTHKGGEEKHLLQKAVERLPQLKALLADVPSHWGYEDPIYRFYHHSFKIYHIQSSTRKIVTELQSLNSFISRSILTKQRGS